MNTTQDKIRAAYWALAKDPQDWIRLARIRAAVSGETRADTDAALIALMRTGLVQLSPDSNTKTLKPEDHAAALHIGNEDMHLIAFEAE